MIPIQAIKQEQESAINEAKTSGRGKAKQYEEILRFPDGPAALAATTGEIVGQLWTRRNAVDTEEGYKIYFSCKGHHNCPKMLFLLHHAECLESSIWLCTSEHVHKKNTKPALPSATVELVKGLMRKGIFKNKIIKEQIKKHNLADLTADQLNNLKIEKNRMKSRMLKDNDMELIDAILKESKRVLKLKKLKQKRAENSQSTVVKRLTRSSARK